MAEIKNKLIELSCEVKESDLQGLMTELENIPNISRKENIKADEKARYELEECQILGNIGKVLHRL